MKKRLLSLAVVLVLVIAMALPVSAAPSDVDGIMTALQGVGVIPDNVLADARAWLTAYDQSNPPGGETLADYMAALLFDIGEAKRLLNEKGIFTTEDLAAWDLTALDGIYKQSLWDCIANACMQFSGRQFSDLRFAWDAGLERIEIHDDIRLPGDTLVTYFSRPEWIAAQKPAPVPADFSDDWVTLHPQDTEVDPAVNPIKQTGGPAIGSFVVISIAVVGLLSVCAVGTRKKRAQG